MIKVISKVATLFSTGFFLAACMPHLSATQCQQMNWSQMGLKDGSQGRNQRDLSNAIADCSKFHLKVDVNEYRSGWKKGIARFCHPTRSLGITDGNQGLASTAIDGRQNFCQTNGLNLSLSQYKSGWLSGIKNYCTAENGRLIAAKGQTLPHVCPENYYRRFASGYKQGANQFCQNSETGFSLGKAGKAYPSSECPQGIYYNFASEYQRGAYIHQRIANLQNEINSLNDQISSLVSFRKIYQHADGYYYPKDLNYQKDVNRANQANHLIDIRRHLNARLYRAQTKGYIG